MKKVVKFGGSSLASAEQFRKVGEIIRSDEGRRYVVPSAPGKRYSDDIKVTDMLYDCSMQLLQVKILAERCQESKPDIRKSSMGWDFSFPWMKNLLKSVKTLRIRLAMTMRHPAVSS